MILPSLSVQFDLCFSDADCSSVHILDNDDMPSRRVFPAPRSPVAPANQHSNMRSGGHGISLRPTRGSAYPAPAPSPTNNSVGADPDPNGPYSWNKNEMPGGRKLWCRLVFAFTAVSLLGAMFVTLAAVFFRASHRMAMEDGMSLPLVWCIIGIGEDLMIHCSL